MDEDVLGDEGEAQHSTAAQQVKNETDNELEPGRYYQGRSRREPRSFTSTYPMTCQTSIYVCVA